MQPQHNPNQQQFFIITYTKNQNTRTDQIPYIKSVKPTTTNSFSKQIKKNHAYFNFSTIGNSSDMNKEESIILAVDASAKYLQFMMVRQDGGGQSYRSSQSIIIADTREYLFQSAEEYFEDGHRDQDCRSMNDGQCDCQKLKNEFVEDLKSSGFAYMDVISSKIQSAKFQIYSFKI